MRRAIIALGIIGACVGLLVCWPLARLWMSHEHGRANVISVLRTPRPDGLVQLRVVWEAQVGPGKHIIGDAQASQFFRPIENPVLTVEQADEASARLLRDHEGRVHNPPLVFWTANNPEDGAFILDVSATHPWRRYIAGLATCIASLIAIRLAWSYGRWRNA
ncbi:MAG: hypothetical protein AAB263_02465 [Planctomycetota bacterium]